MLLLLRVLNERTVVWQIRHSDIRAPSIPDGFPADNSAPQLQPQLVAGETRSGFLTAAFKRKYTESREYPSTLNALRLKELLT